MPFHANFWPLFDLKIPVQPSEVMLSFFLIASYLNKREKINWIRDEIQLYSFKEKDMLNKFL
mgnify:CR=1 FL=1